MAVVIRLRREGSKDRPYYRMVVADSRQRRDGRYIDVVGTYNPMQPSHPNYTVDLEKIDSWVAKGAKPSETIASIVRKERRKLASAASVSEVAP